MLEERGSTVYRGVLTSGCWKRGFHCIQRCPHFRERGSTVYRGVLTSGRGVPLYTEVSSLHWNEGWLPNLLVLSSFVFPNRFISDHGSVKASASSISLGVSILAGATEKGQPNVTSTGCDFNVGHLSVKLNGGAR